MTKPESKFFTKELFMKALECPTKIFYASNSGYVNKVTEDTYSTIFQDSGFQVQELARLYYSGGYLCPNNDKLKAFAWLKYKLMNNENIILYEAPIIYDKFFFRIDILEKKGDVLNLIEVKSKSFNSREESFLGKNEFLKSKWKSSLYDVAFQTILMEKAFPDFIIKPHLMLADKLTRSSIDGLHQLIKIKHEEDGTVRVIHTKKGITSDDLGNKILKRYDVKELVNKINEGTDIEDSKKSLEGKKSFWNRMNEYAEYFQTNSKYPITLSKKCKYCEFRVDASKLISDELSGFKECWSSTLGWRDKDFDKDHVFDLWYYPQINDVLEKRIYFLKDFEIEDLKQNSDRLYNRQYRQLQTVFEPDGNEIIDQSLFDEMMTWIYPLHFIDFETINPAIPFHKGKSPYSILAYQYSIHSIHQDGSITHIEWLNKEQGGFPNFQFIRHLKTALSNDNGTIFQYTTYENGVLNTIFDQIKEEFENHPEKIPDGQQLMEWIRLITVVKEKGKIIHEGTRKMVDLCEIVILYYYHHLMKGSNSIKVVLPAILNASPFLQEYYKTPYVSSNFKSGIVFAEQDSESGLYKNPYSLLPHIDIKSFKIKSGTDAIIAYSLLQYSDLSDIDVTELHRGLLKYCELDTLAMVMIYQHWKNQLDLKSN